MTRKKKRAVVIAGALTLLFVSVGLVAFAFKDNLVFFLTPTDVVAGKAKGATKLRIGGMVENGSLKRLEDGLTVSFEVTDFSHSIPVTYTGLLPNLFKEGQGVIAEGSFEENGKFKAKTILAKHDEKYVPRELQDTMKKKPKAETTSY
ncbi:MAG: cytochrome c-type biogenesis protein CcmE [Methyloligella sp.]|jgi:cytochrome c-type biogenesis protein CcmE|nr:MAG: cytochrome c-type biogenesis protein CcmE [Methyloligella sp.]